MRLWYAFDEVIFISTLVGLYLGSRWFFRNHILRDYDVTNWKVQAAFCVIFTLACAMFELVALEILDIFDETYVNWKLAIYCQLSLLLVLIPFYEFYSIARSFGLVIKRALICAVALLLGFLYLLRYIDNPLTKHQFGMLSVEMGVTRVATIGVTLIAFLTGFGAVNAIYSNLSFFLSTPKEDEVQSLEQHLSRTIDRVFQKKKKIFGLQAEKKRTADSPSRWGINSLVNITTMFSRDGRAPSIESLQFEVDALEGFARELFLEVNEQRANRARAEWAKTLWGRISDIWAACFSLYCLYKLIMAIVNIVKSRAPGTDPVTRTIAIALALVHVQIDARFWSQMISFAFVGVIMVTSLRSFILQLMKIVNRYTSSLTYNTVVLFLSHLLGMYCMSSVLLLRMSLPEKYRATITMVLGDIEFLFYHRWFDYIFLPSSLVTMVFFYVQHKTSRSRGSPID